MDINKYVLICKKLASYKDRKKAFEAFDQVVKDSYDLELKVRKFDLLDLMKYAPSNAQVQVCLLYYRYFTEGLSDVSNDELKDVYSSYEGVLDSIVKAVEKLDPILWYKLIKETDSIDPRIDVDKLFLPYSKESTQNQLIISVSTFEQNIDNVIRSKYDGFEKFSKLVTSAGIQAQERLFKEYFTLYIDQLLESPQLDDEAILDGQLERILPLIKDLTSELFVELVTQTQRLNWEDDPNRSIFLITNNFMNQSVNSGRDYAEVADMIRLSLPKLKSNYPQKGISIRETWPSIAGGILTQMTDQAKAFELLGAMLKAKKSEDEQYHTTIINLPVDHGFVLKYTENVPENKYFHEQGSNIIKVIGQISPLAYQDLISMVNQESTSVKESLLALNVGMIRSVNGEDHAFGFKASLLGTAFHNLHLLSILFNNDSNLRDNQIGKLPQFSEELIKAAIPVSDYDMALPLMIWNHLLITRSYPYFNGDNIKAITWYNDVFESLPNDVLGHYFRVSGSEINFEKLLNDSPLEEILFIYKLEKYYAGYKKSYQIIPQVVHSSFMALIGSIDISLNGSIKELKDRENFAHDLAISIQRTIELMLDENDRSVSLPHYLVRQTTNSIVSAIKEVNRMADQNKKLILHDLIQLLWANDKLREKNKQQPFFEQNLFNIFPEFSIKRRLSVGSATNPVSNGMGVPPTSAIQDATQTTAHFGLPTVPIINSVYKVR